MKKLVRITTVVESLDGLLTGQLKYMGQSYEVIGISSYDDRFKTLEHREGITMRAVKMTRRITPIQDLRAVYQLYKIFKQEKPFIVHTHTPKAGTVGMIAAKLADVPNRLHTIAGLPLLEAKGAKRLLLNTVEKLTYKCASLILPNSFALKEIILNQKFTTAPKLKVIGNGSSNGIDVKHYDASQVSEQKKSNLFKRYKINPTDFVFIFIGRLVKDKGINELVIAFEDLCLKNKHCKLLLVGGREDHLDPLRKETEHAIDNNDQILDVGFQDDIRPFVAISNALVFPSYREGFPNAVLQASCMQLPCIVTDINGCNEIIENGVNGLIIPVKDSKALEEAMQYTLDHPEKVNYMIKNSRNRIIERYSQDYVWSELLKTYKELEKNDI
jgi:glycosyltransferase involved in cell wall biosynthesis